MQMARRGRGAVSTEGAVRTGRGSTGVAEGAKPATGNAADWKSIYLKNNPDASDEVKELLKYVDSEDALNAIIKRGNRRRFLPAKEGEPFTGLDLAKYNYYNKLIKTPETNARAVYRQNNS